MMAHGLPPTDKITVAVITGGHNFDVPGFIHLLRSMADDFDFYIQSLENFAADAGKVREQYDVLLFYHMPKETPAHGDKIRTAMEQLGETGQGILLLHHALVAYKAWPYWSELVGIEDRNIDYHHDEVMQLCIADPTHPITLDLNDWEMIDETYLMPEPEQSQVLLTTDHPQSMHAIAWIRQFRRSRLFCFQSGHDNQTWVHPSFRTVLRRGIYWCAGRL
jgi:type 1 glutamine amidotransferase